jgi:hypothetical protein
MDILTKLTGLTADILQLPPEDLDALLAATTLTREADTHFAGMIRILEFEHRLFVQEQHPETKQVLVRHFGDRTAADVFVQDRLDTYERMWDGCGCKVHYFE